MIALSGLPMDLSGWLAMVGIARILAPTGALLGYELTGARGMWDPWRPVVDLALDELATEIANARLDAPRDAHPLRWYAGRQSAATTLTVARRLLGTRDIAADLTIPHSPDPGCPTFGWAADSAIPAAYRAPGAPASSGRPLIEVLAWQGLGVLRWEPDRRRPWWPLFPPERAPGWLRRTVRRPRSVHAGRHPRELWGCSAPLENYRRSASAPSPMLVQGRGLVLA